MTDVISSTANGFCDCCKRIKIIQMYVLQNGETAWICKSCRKGKNNAKPPS